MSISEDQLSKSGRTDAPAPVAASTARYARKKQAIIAAACEILNRDGVKGMTLSNVASRVGLITTSVTYYFKKKEDLAVACLLDSIERFDAMMEGALQAGDPRSQLRSLIDAWLSAQRGICETASRPLRCSTTSGRCRKSSATSCWRAYLRFFAKLRRIFEHPDFAWLDENSRTARAQIVTEQVFWAVAWLPRYDYEDYGRLRDRMCDILFHGLALENAAWHPGSLALDEVLAHGQALTAHETFLIAATRLINEKRISRCVGRTHLGPAECHQGLVLSPQRGQGRSGRTSVSSAASKRCAAVQRAVTDQSTDDWARLTTIAASLVDYQFSERGPLLRSLSSVSVAGVDPSRHG